MSGVSSKELYEFKKTLKELANKRGRGTELVSVYIPPSKQLSDVGKHMRDEMGQSANIKSKQTRKNVQSAIAVILESIKLYKQPPENGIVLFVGMIPKAVLELKRWKNIFWNRRNLFRLTGINVTMSSSWNLLNT